MSIKGKVARFFSNRKQKLMIPNCRKKAYPANGKTVLFWHHAGLSGLLGLEVYFALALQLRGYSPHFVLCDGTAPACLSRQGETGDIDAWRLRCPECMKNHEYILKKMGFPYTPLRELLSRIDTGALYAEMPELPEDVKRFSCNGMDLVENLMSGLIRYNMHGDLSAVGPRVIKEFAFDAACNWLGCLEAIERLKPASLFMSHCIFTDFGPPYKAAQAADTHVFTYQVAHQANTMMFSSLSKDSLVPGPSLTEEVWLEIANDGRDEVYADKMEKFYAARYIGQESFGDMKNCLPGVANDRERLLERYGVDGSKPVFALFTQIRWDASADFTKLIFPTYDEFTLASIAAMAENPRVHWLIKVHPAEKNEPLKAQTELFIRRHFPTLPGNITIIPFDSPFSPLDFFNAIDGGVTGCGTSGLELAAMGKPVITAAQFLYSRRGFTFDSENVDDFINLLGRAESLPKLDEAQKLLAQKYLVTYLYRQAIPIAPLSNETWGLPDYRDVSQLLPNNNKYIDLIMAAFENKRSALLPLDWIC